MNWKSIERSGDNGEIVHIKMIKDGEPHRAPFNPGDDLSLLPKEVQALISTVHTPELIAAAKAKQGEANKRHAEAVEVAKVVAAEAEAAAKAAEEARFREWAARNGLMK